MSIKPGVIRELIGKEIHDRYGRIRGRVLAVSTGTRRDAPIIWIEGTDGSVSSCSSSQIIVDGDYMVLSTSWSQKTSRLNEELETILRKKSALIKLFNNGEVVKEVYEKIRMEYEAAIQPITRRHHRMFKEARDRLEELNTQIDQIELLSANLKLDRVIGNVDEEVYNATSESLRRLLEMAYMERDEVEAALRTLKEASTNTGIPEPEAERGEDRDQPIFLSIEEAEV